MNTAALAPRTGTAHRRFHHITRHITTNRQILTRGEKSGLVQPPAGSDYNALPNWDEVREGGVRIAAAIHSDRILPAWIELFDDALALFSFGSKLSEELRSLLRDSSFVRKNSYGEVPGEERDNENALYERSSQQLPVARARLAAFWRQYDILVSDLQRIGRGGILRVSAGGTKKAEGSAP